MKPLNSHVAGHRLTALVCAVLLVVPSVATAGSDDLSPAVQMPIETYTPPQPAIQPTPIAQQPLPAPVISQPVVQPTQPTQQWSAPSQYTVPQNASQSQRNLITLAITQAVSQSLGGIVFDLIGKIGRALIGWLDGLFSDKPKPTEVANLSKSGVFSKALEYPAIGLGEFEKLDSNKPGALVLSKGAFEKLPDGSGSNYRMTVHTGENVAFKFTTSVPGRARLFSIDATGSHYQNEYDAMPLADNRFPRKAAFQVEGAPGTEWLDIEFTPCIPDNMRNDARAQPFKESGLAVCKAYESGGQASDKSAKLMANPETSAETAITVTPTGYSKGESMRLRIEIQHLSPK